MNSRMSMTKVRIMAAFLAGVILVGGSVYLRSKQGVPTGSTSEETVLAIGERKHIPVTDSDLDGIPDWQAALVRTEPIYIDASSTEVYVPSNTVTDQFIYRFNQDIATLDVYGMLDETREDLIEAAVKDIEKSTMEEIYERDDLSNIITTTDSGALKSYGNIVGGTFYTFLKSDETEFEIFDKLTREQNPRHIEKLKVIEGYYDAMIKYLLAMEVPEAYVFEHLAIVNALSAQRENVHGMQLLYDDPYYTAARYRRFIEDFLVLKNAVNALYNTLYLDEGITFAERDALRVLVGDLQ